MAVNRIGGRKAACKKIVCKKTFFKQTVVKKTVCGQSFGKKCSGKKFIRARSAFSAVAGTDQILSDGVFAKVQYQVQELDLRNEYNSATSTFRPRQNGIYSLLASVSFETITLTPVTMDLQIRVNGVARISDQENFTPRTGIIDASGIIQLKARDRVEVFARATGENGEIQSGLATRFEGARIS